jgi:phage-related minor tail protein
MIVLGAIIWGVQLNLAIIESAKLDARQNNRIEILEAMSREQAINQARTATILDEVSRRLERYDNRIGGLERGRSTGSQGSH